MIAAMFGYALPFILVALLFLLWSWSGYKFRFRYPRFYEFNLKVYENLPKITAFIIIVGLIILFFTTETNYD